jgi:hypothetical protein
VYYHTTSILTLSKTQMHRSDHTAKKKERKKKEKIRDGKHLRYLLVSGLQERGKRLLQTLGY